MDGWQQPPPVYPSVDTQAAFNSQAMPLGSDQVFLIRDLGSGLWDRLLPNKHCVSPGVMLTAQVRQSACGWTALNNSLASANRTPTLYLGRLGSGLLYKQTVFWSASHNLTAWQ